MCHLESLQTVAALGLLTDDVEYTVDQFGPLCVVTLRPVVAGTALAEHEVVRSEELTERTGSNRVHGAGLEVDQYGARNIFTT